MTRKKLLVISPHPDDESIGAGATIKKYSDNGYDVTVLTIAGHLPPLYEKGAYELTVNEAKNAHNVLGVSDSIFLGIPATTLGHMPVHELNGKINSVVNEIEPEIVLCPFPDRHVDHKVVFEASLVATRPYRKGTSIKKVAAYEIPSSTHWNAPHIEPNFTPSWVVDITDYIDSKLEAVACYKSQIMPYPGPRCIEAIKALAQFRGTQAGFAYGEALHVIRMST